MSELRKLTWKYFWKQKWQEAKEPLQVITSIFGVLGFMMLIGGAITGDKTTLIIGICMIVPFTLFIIAIFIKWIRNNWKKASKRAEEELESGPIKELSDLNQETIL